MYRPLRSQRLVEISRKLSLLKLRSSAFTGFSNTVDTRSLPPEPLQLSRSFHSMGPKSPSSNRCGVLVNLTRAMMQANRHRKRNDRSCTIAVVEAGGGSGLRAAMGEYRDAGKWRKNRLWPLNGISMPDLRRFRVPGAGM